MSVKNLSQDCRLYSMATEEFTRLAPDAVMNSVEITGDGSVKIRYTHENDSDVWNVDIIHLVQSNI